MKKKTKKPAAQLKKTAAQLDREIAQLLHQRDEIRRQIDQPKVKLREKREAAAQAHFEDADLPKIEETGRWTEDGDYWSIPVYWTNEDEGGDSIYGSYGVEFAPNSAKIIGSWHQ